MHNADFVYLCSAAYRDVLPYGVSNTRCTLRLFLLDLCRPEPLPCVYHICS